MVVLLSLQSIDHPNKGVAVVLKQQSISAVAPSPAAQFSHHLSLLKSHTDTQRKESLSFLTTSLKSRSENAGPLRPVKTVLPQIIPLILDPDTDIRGQVLKILSFQPADDLEDHIGNLLLHINAGMNHLAISVGSSSMDLLSLVLDTVGEQAVTSVGGWVKTLKSFQARLGWNFDDNPGTWTSSKASLIRGKTLVHTLNTFSKFLRVGLCKASSEKEEPPVSCFPLAQHVRQHMLPTRSNTYAHLCLYGEPPDEESQMYEDREDRQRIFHKRFQKAVNQGLEFAQQEGGEVGRASAGMRKVVLEGMNDYNVIGY